MMIRYKGFNIFAFLTHMGSTKKFKFRLIRIF